jgi:hypothetical protein
MSDRTPNHATPQRFPRQAPSGFEPEIIANLVPALEVEPTGSL